VLADLAELALGVLSTPFQGLRIRDRKLERALLISLEESGQLFPITVIPGDRPGTSVVIDGHRRVRGLRKLGQDRVRAQVLDLPAGEALLRVRVGQMRTPLSALEEGLLVQELVHGQGLSLEVIASRVARSKSWVSRRLDLIEVLPEPVRGLVVAGQIPPSSAMKVLVPLARANADHAQILARAIAEGGLSTRETERLYTYYRSPDRQIREELLANPLKFLKAEKAYRSAHPGSDSDEQEMRERLERLTAMLAATSTRARKLLREGHDSPPARRLAPACALVCQAMEALTGVLAPVTNTNEPGVG
jgi:ParB/RepB/Spo0J family partition protein